MLDTLRRVFDPNNKEVKRLRERVAEVNEYGEEIGRLSDEQLRAKTEEFRQKLDSGASLDDILPEAFAVVREASQRVLGLRHFDVQLMGGMALHEGKIAEMRTGEGKTLVATLPVYLNALTGRGVHIVTVNEYLAARDAEWMGSIYRFLGLTVGVVRHSMNFDERRNAYHADVTYGTNNEFGFDYLRDNMVWEERQMVQRELAYAIVDEVDSILIDEARTPLIISGPVEQSTEKYARFAKLVPRLKVEEDYTVDEKAKSAALTEEGVAKVERELGVDNLYADENYELTHYVQQALRAHSLFQRDRDYVVKDGQVIIVDEFTGRLMFGRRYGDGLHQAIEAKEGVKIERESQTLATVTFQNYFRMYDKLAGMTGTAKTEEGEFQKIYGMDVVSIPTHKPLVRDDAPDLVYKTVEAKFNAVVEEIEEMHELGRPVLVGTVSIEWSERLSAMLSKRGIAHRVLNAKHHEQEAEIIAQAGKPGAVTIATNMAGRGTDILLGGNPEFLARERMRKKGFTDEEVTLAAEPLAVQQAMKAAAESESDEATQKAQARLEEARRTYNELLDEAKNEVTPDHERVIESGGLHIIGTERHESRRIDNQLRGRAGRQGDPGSSRFYVSMEDDLMRLFGSERIVGLMERLGWEDDQPIEHNQITRSIENAQKKVEDRNFEARKQVLQFDDVMNQQREVIYDQRRKVLKGENLKPTILGMVDHVVDTWLNTYIDPKVHPEEWDLTAVVERVAELVQRPGELDASEFAAESREALKDKLVQMITAAYEAQEEEIGSDLMRQGERITLLRVIDAKWMEHLRAMDDLREGIGLRAYGQRNPLLEYKSEGFNMFQSMMDSIQEEVVGLLLRMQVRVREGAGTAPGRASQGLAAAAASRAGNGAAAAPQQARARAQAAHRDAVQQARAQADQRLQQIVTNRGEDGGASNGRPKKPAPRRVEQKVGRNDPCPCGSGKKYKKCHGAA